MRTAAFASLASLSLCFLSLPAQAQEPLPPPGSADPGPPPPPPPPPAAAPGGGVPGYQPPGYVPGQAPPPGVAPPPGAAPPPAAAPPGAPPPPAGAPPPVASGQVQWGLESGFDASAQGAAAPRDEDQDEYEERFRKTSLQLQNSLSGSTGLLRLSEAGSGAVGTFRISLLTSYFTGAGFLCREGAVCPPPPGQPAFEDETSRIGAHLGLSVTPLPFLEAFAALHSHATSNDQGQPELLQVLGDTQLGAKAFLPAQEDRIFNVGGQLELWLLNGTGGVGIEGGGTGFALRALGTADFTNRRDPKERLPIRAHANIGYRFDNSGSLVDDVEANRGNMPITRIERFGLDINKVDFFQIGLGADFPVHEVVRPFFEWSIDIPVNRQSYTCNVSRRYPGDECLGDAAGFGSTPSRLTLGTRLYPGLDGLAFTGAFDIGTGATSDFIEEVAPELPWNLWLGVSFAYDTNKPKLAKRIEVERIVAAPPEPRRFIEGTVVDKTSGEPVADAIVRYDGRNLTGMVTGGEGRFRTADLEPGAYTFNVSADGYRDGTCAVSVPNVGASAAPGAPPGALPPGQPGLPPGPGAAPPGGYTPPGYPQAPGAPPPPGGQMQATGRDVVVTVQCELQPLAKVGNVIGTAANIETGAPIPNAKVKITDKLGRELELTADGAGAFRFENVPQGTVKIRAEADGYLPNVVEIDVEAREDLRTRINLAPRPARPNVTITAKEVKIAKQVHFQHDSADILPDSMAILAELAEVLKEHDELRLVEIQGHTDDTGAAPYNLRLSQERAEAVKGALVDLGVDASRLTAKGYGQEKPILPNTNDANRARNRRVQLLILERGR